MRPSICHIASRAVLDDLVETQGSCDIRAVVQQPSAVDAPGASGAAVEVVELVEQSACIANGRVDERQHVVTERRRLRLLQVGLVWHQRVDVPTRERGRATGELLNLTHELEQLVADVDPKCDPRRLAARPPCVQPSGDLT
jgi:hypothetical protein